MEEKKRHHVWYNFFHRPVEGCKMCKELREKYPETNNLGDMMKKYFPENIER